MTSNIGSQMIQEISESGGDEQEMRRAVTDALQARFLPEFLNRIDETIIFHPLDRKQIRIIVGLQMRLLGKQLEQNKLGLEVTDAALDQIANEGYDPTYGARPLKRAIQQQLQNPLATELLKGGFTEGDGVKIDYRKGKFTFERTEAAQTKQTEKKDVQAASA